MNIILIGYMGSGKTTLGKKIAKRMGMEFVDTDQCIELEEKKTISEIFALHGEPYFRELERKLIDRLRSCDNLLIATGGGLPCFFNLMETLNSLGTTVYLKRPAKELAHRVFYSKKKRPLTEGKSLEELVVYIETVLQEREVYYSQAHVLADRHVQHVGSLELLLKTYLRSGMPSID